MADDWIPSVISRTEETGKIFQLCPAQQKALQGFVRNDRLKKF
jgi:hypothetical protein